MNELKIWTDGACFPNPGRGGWAWCTQTSEGFGFGGSETTNNRMEMMAVIEAIRANKSPGVVLTIVSDSEYVINGCTKWIAKWKKNGWVRKGGVKNMDLWKSIDWELQSTVVGFEWVRGHSGDEMNERADKLAAAAAAAAPMLGHHNKAGRSISWLKEQS